MCVWVCGVFVMYLGASAKSNTIISFNFQCHLNRRRKSFLINFLLHKGVENLQQIAVQKIWVFPLSISPHHHRRWNFLFISSWHVSNSPTTTTWKNLISCRERKREKPPREGGLSESIFYFFSQFSNLSFSTWLATLPFDSHSCSLATTIFS